MFIYVKIIILAFVVFLAIDLIWLSLIANNLYQRELSGLLKEKFDLLPAFIFYFIFIVGLTIFVIEPSIESNSIVKAITLGALFGLVTYATYDLTNLATLEGFPLKIVLIDLTWGTFVSTLTSVLTYLIYVGFLK